MNQTSQETHSGNGPQATPDLTAEERALLAGLDQEERQMVADVMRQHPLLTFAEAVEALRDAGM